MNLVKLQPGQLACIDCGQAVDHPDPSTIVEKIAEHQQLWINGQPASTVQLPGPKVTQVARCIICTDTRERAQALADRFPQVVHALGYDGYGLELVSGALTALGVACGFVLGLLISLILVFVVNPQSFHWTMQLHLPWGLLAGVAALLLAAAVLTALGSGRYALSGGPIRAVREDW